MLKVLITDDHPVVRRGIRQILEDDERIVLIHEAGSGNEMFNRLRNEEYNVILLDVSLPGGNGIDLIPQVKKNQKSASILILSIHSEEMYAIKALQAGASGYLSKLSAPEELICAVYKVAKGERYISPQLAEKLAGNLLGELEKPLFSVLSVREKEVLHHFTAGKTVSQIADELSLSPKTISTYRERILEKLNIKTTADIIRYGIKEGLGEEK